MTFRNIYIYIGIFLSFTFIVTIIPNTLHALTTQERATLMAQLADVQAEQVKAQKDLASAQSKSSSLQRDITILATNIKIEQLNIQAKTLLIQTLGDNITEKQIEIRNLDAKIAQNKINMADIFRQLELLGNDSMVETLLSSQTLSQSLDEIITLEMLHKSIYNLSTQLAIYEASSTAQKNTLVSKQNSAIDARYAIQQEQKKIQANQTQQKKLLSISKTNEKAYTALIAQKKKEVDAINAKLFSLAGGSSPIPFSQAYQYALAAQKKTGIDPAFLLAVLTQESNLGSNQGTCYLTDPNTGAGQSIKSGRIFTNVMSPTRDVPPFIKITTAMNADPLHTIVSCPQSVGWGGAMGPAQFIASTWMLFSSRIGSALGFSGMANPWNPQHAFMASALYLTDLGANKGGYTAKSNAACRYYSGSNCSKSKLVASYGSSVMTLANTIQTTEIDKILGL